jgi:hypothetical protein
MPRQSRWLLSFAALIGLGCGPIGNDSATLIFRRQRFATRIGG